MHGLDALQQGRVGRGAGGRWPLQPGIVTRLGHAEHACHRGNREAGLVRAHEPEEPDGSVPVSRANQAAAFERISRSSRSCLFSRRSRVNSSRSNAVRPGAASSRRPSFRSTWATHARMEWPLGSNSRARSSGLRPARTRSTICRRNSGEYGGRVLGIGSTSGENSGCPPNRVNPIHPQAGSLGGLKRVKANQGAAGVDRQSIADFEADLSNNLYQLWNWLSSGKRFSSTGAAGRYSEGRRWHAPIGHPDGR